MKTIPLTQGKFALIDDADFDLVSKFKWCAQNRPSGICYAVTRFPGSRKLIYLHRFVMGEPSGMMVDHINHNGLDNQKENLRSCTCSQNQMNRTGAQMNSTSGARGVSLKKISSQWQAQIRLNGRLKYLGLFSSIGAASAAYVAANAKYFGDFGGISR